VEIIIEEFADYISAVLPEIELLRTRIS